MTGHGVMRAGPLRAVASWLARTAGSDAEAILERAGVPTGLAPDGLMAFEVGVRLLEDAARILDRDDAGVLLARELRWSDFGVLGYVVVNAPTVGASLASLRRYFAIQQTAGVFSLIVDGEQAQVRYALRAAPHVPARQHALAVLAMLVRLVREGTGDGAWAPDEVAVPGLRIRKLGDAAGFFAAPLRHDADHAGLSFPAALLRRPMVTADPHLFPILVQHADACLASVPATVDDPLGEVRRMVASMLGTSGLAIDDVAGRMGVSARTVQRQLQAQGLSFKQVVDEVRRSLAVGLLADPTRSLTDAAFLVGYSDLSAFSRAFRRWTGQSPQSFRRAPTLTPP